MSRTPARVTQADVARESGGFVYVASIGKHIKIGFSRNVAKRLKAFETSSATVELLAAFPGGTKLEKLIHRLLSDIKIRNEIFLSDWRITQFVHLVEKDGIESGLQFLEETTPGRQKQKREEERLTRIKVARQTKEQKDAYFASLVAERKNKLGW